MRPAMTSEEWEDTLLRVPAGEPVGYLRGAGRVTDPSRCHQLAACCLHGQPFGFTPHDVWALRFVLDRADLSDRGPVGEGWPSREMRDAVLLVRLVATRIEALLPPVAP